MVIKETNVMHLKRKYEEFKNLDFWQLQKISELLQEAIRTPDPDTDEQISDLEDEVDELKSQLEEAEHDLDRSEREYSELQDKYNLLKSEKENEDKI